MNSDKLLPCMLKHTPRFEHWKIIIALNKQFQAYSFINES